MPCLQVNPMEIIAIIPALNEEKTLQAVIEGTLEYIQNIIVISDGSTDRTQAIINQYPVQCIQNPTRLGKGASLLKAFALAKEQQADAVLTLDADGQHLPQFLPDFINAATHYPESLLIGVRQNKTAHAPKLRHMANCIADFWISWAAGSRLKDTQCGYRLYPIKSLPKTSEQCSLSDGFSDESRLLINSLWQGYSCLGVPISTIYKEDARPSYFHPSKDVMRIIRIVATKLLQKKFNLPGLYQVIFGPPMTILNNNLLKQAKEERYND
ncbi:glycosyltransferase family 2 protein [Piscirickettsia litoralis]|uniref:Glycosyltransferase 2-like domain-containing protein n=1 Tax=Piscirickettsia litoralis TaxID=1891921 RepID=A0ABX3A5M8_9GAMM|nr:glycosyltransferase family 2 protein [Piscirickettsia litoralis]ODN42755.1 hypothetical protein BGC07_07240 [Piscirickettsia litoralis]